jgi:hypothetical protein
LLCRGLKAGENVLAGGTVDLPERFCKLGARAAAAVKMTIEAAAVATNEQMQANINTLPAVVLGVEVIAGEIGKLFAI